MGFTGCRAPRACCHRSATCVPGDGRSQDAPDFSRRCRIAIEEDCAGIEATGRPMAWRRVKSSARPASAEDSETCERGATLGSCLSLHPREVAGRPRPVSRRSRTRGRRRSVDRCPPRRPTHDPAREALLLQRPDLVCHLGLAPARRPIHPGGLPAPRVRRSSHGAGSGSGSSSSCF